MSHDCCDTENDITEAERLERARRDAEAARAQGHDRLADTILRDAGIGTD